MGMGLKEVLGINKIYGSLLDRARKIKGITVKVTPTVS